MLLWLASGSVTEVLGACQAA